MSTVRSFFQDKTLLITGATGFLGQPLVEKLLWAIPELCRIYVLIRPKRQFGGRILSPQERLERELYQSSVFDRLQSRHNERLAEFLQEKLIAVAGDIGEENLGLDPATHQRLLSEVNVVINSAAVVSFDANLADALRLNVLGAERVAQFAVSCENACLIHVSTAYVCGAATSVVPETIHHTATRKADTEDFPSRQFSDVDRELAEVRSIISRVEQAANERDVETELLGLLRKRIKRLPRGERKGRREKLEGLRRQWIASRLAEQGMAWARQRGWNDTYTYTKALGEQVVLRARGEIPTLIVRPSVIESSLSEPSPGWLDGLRMADPLIVAIGKGRLQALPLNPAVNLDLVPVDMVVNALLAAAPAVARKGGVEVIQVATTSRNPINLGQLYDLIWDYFARNPMLDKEGNPIRLKRLRFPHPRTFRLQHRLRAMPLATAERTLERLRGFAPTAKVRRRISATKTAYEKLYYYGEIYEPYLNLTCAFETRKIAELYNNLDEDEKREFNFDVTRVNWRHYVQNVHIPGVKKFILKLEGSGTMEVAEHGRPSEPMPETINELLRISADRFGQKSALQVRRGEEWVRYSFSAIYKQSLEIAHRFTRAGLKKGDRVVLFSENQPEWGLAYFGAAAAGLVVVPLDSQTWHREVWSVAEFTEARALLVSEKCLKKLPQESLERNEEAHCPVLLFNVDRMCAAADLPEYPRSSNPSMDLDLAAGGLPVVEADDVASIIFTTGTAVDPRGAVHTHANFLNNLQGVNHYLSVSETDQLLSVLPLYHALEFSCGFLMPIYSGCCVTYAPSLKPKALLETMRETGTTCLLGVPTLFSLLREDIERRVLGTAKSALRNSLMARSKQLSHSVERRLGRSIGGKLFASVHQEFGGNIRIFVSGGSALGERLYWDFKALGMPIYEGYGLTETAPVLTVNPRLRSRAGSAGKPLPGVELRLSHPDGDGVGEIIVRTPSLMKGYFKNPEATERVIQNGWFHTGDLGWVDADGYVYITGRTKDVIVTGAGKNVYPSDLEAIYGEVEGIREIAVVGIKSGLTEDVHGIIVPSVADGDPAELEAVRKGIQRRIQAFAKELPSYNRLQAVHFWSEPLPRGKDEQINRQRIREALQKQEAGGRVAEPATFRKSKEVSLKEVLLSELGRITGEPIGEISEEQNLFTELGLDSLMAVELLFFLEQHLGIVISDEKAASFQTVGDVLDELRRYQTGDREDVGDAVADTARIASALPLLQRSALDRLLMGASVTTLRTFFKRYFRLSLVNAAVVPKSGAYILAANHSSHLDTAAVLSALSMVLGTEGAQRVHVVGARDYFFDSALKSWFFTTCLNVVPIDRDEVSLEGLRMVRSILKNGEPVLIFPEGSRSRSGTLQPFRPGIGLIAREVNVPVVPAYIDGTFEALPAGQAFPRRNNIKIVFGSPILMEEYQVGRTDASRDEVYRKIAADVRSAIERLSEAETVTT